MKPKIYESWLVNLAFKVFKYKKPALTLGKIIYFKKDAVTIDLLAHEIQHARQFVAYGWFMYISKTLWYKLFRKNEQTIYEINAIKYQQANLQIAGEMFYVHEKSKK